MIVKRITLADLPVERFRGRCVNCAFVTLSSQYPTTAETLAEMHVRDTGHSVNIEDSGPDITSAGA